MPASGGNDENFLIIQGSTDLADSYGIEVMRIYDHYRARWAAKQSALNRSSQPLALATTGAWTDRYFVKDSLPCRDRLRFIGK